MSERVKVTNLTDLAMSVTISDGKVKTAVQIMGKARGVSLPPGFDVDARWLSLNTNKVKVIKPLVTSQVNEVQE